MTPREVMWTPAHGGHVWSSFPGMTRRRAQLEEPRPSPAPTEHWVPSSRWSQTHAHARTTSNRCCRVTSTAVWRAQVVRGISFPALIPSR